jgi:hypothetical protein
MSTSKGIWFVYRSHYEGPLSKRVRRIDSPTILAWFQEKLADARSSATPRDVADADLGGPVHGFGSLLAAAKEKKLAAPKSTTALLAMLQKHLRVEGGPGNIRLDDHTLRVATDDDEVSLAYYFFDDEAKRAHDERIAWLLEEDPDLVDGDEDGPFEPPVPVRALGPAGEGEGATYACLLTFHDSDSIPGSSVVLRGARLPELAAHLRRTIPDSAPASWSAEYLDTWPVEMRLLRAMIGHDDATVEPALRRAASYPLSAVMTKVNHTRLGVGPHPAARDEFAAAAEGKEHGGEPEKSLVHVHDHVAVLCVHASKFFGYQQWILFDDRWAAAYPDLAGSLLIYAADWDPFPAEEESAQERAFHEAVGDRAPEEARRYKPADRFAAGEMIEHAKFGLGVVKRVEVTKIEVIFCDQTRTLAHGAG